MSRRAPRLQFTDEELAAPEVSKAAKKAAKRIEKLEQAEAKIPTKNGAEKPRPKSKLQHAVRDTPVAAVRSAAHREIRKSEDDNVGVESAHKLEEAAEQTVRAVETAHRSHQLKPYRSADRAEARADSANLDALQKQAQQQNPELQSNPYSRWQQKRAIKKEYAAAKAGGGTVRASEVTAKAAKRAAEDTKKASEWIAEHKKGFLIALAILLVAVFLLNIASSCSVLVEGGVTALGVSTYPSEDSDMLAAEAQYCAMEAELQSKLDNYEATHDYDEYHFDLDEIGHDPYVLISALTALKGGAWTLSEVQGELQMLFDKQYILTETVETEIRYRPETRHDEDGDPYDKYSNKQFISIETRGGETFYLVIDYDKPLDEDGEQYETFFLNMVDEADLLALIDEEEAAEETCVCTVHCEVGAINTACPICKASMVDCMGKTPVAEKEPEPAAPAETEPEPETTQENTKKSSAPLLLILLVLLGGGFALYWFKFRKPKANTKGPVDLDDYDFGEENEDEEELEPEESES